MVVGYAQGDRQTERSPRLTARLDDPVGQGRAGKSVFTKTTLIKIK